MSKYDSAGPRPGQAVPRPEQPVPSLEQSGLSPEQARTIAEECYGEVLAYCRRHAPAGHEAADLAQETFLRFVRAKTYRERGKPLAYLMRTARSVCADAARNRRPVTVSLDFEVPDERAAEVPDEAVGEDADKTDPMLAAALERLPVDLRDAVELRFGAGLGVGEVARALGISRFSARRRINAALRILKQELGEGDSSE